MVLRTIPTLSRKPLSEVSFALASFIESCFLGVSVTANKHAISVAAVLVAAVLALVPSAAWGETAPGNDEITGATLIPLPGAVNQATTGATASVTDPAACWSNSAATMWYRVVSPTAGTIRVTGYYGGLTDAIGIALFTGSPDSLQPVACGTNNPNAQGTVVTTDIQAGQLYIMVAVPDSSVIDDGLGEYIGISVAYVLPDPRITSFTIDRKGSVTKAGTATISGTITCQLRGNAGLRMTLTQPTGRSTATATTTGLVQCTPSTRHWSMSMTSSTTLRFGAKKATASGTAETSGDLGSSTLTTTQVVTLHSTK